MPEQALPGYKEDFRAAPWMFLESEHYIFHYFKDTLAEKEIAQIISTQEQGYGRILEFIELPPPSRKISYYLYPDSERKEMLMGSSWFAQSIYRDFAVHALYTSQNRVIGPHEDTHLLSLPLGLSVGFLQEGLAERMVGHDWFGHDFLQTVKEILPNKEFVISDDLLTNHQAWINTSDDLARQFYSFAALFSYYLTETYGKAVYLKLYAALKREDLIENKAKYLTLLGESSENVWKQFLNSKLGIHK